MQIKQYTPEDFKSVPWKNGRGHTTELCFEDLEGSDAFVWRLSMAPVISDGVFSDFSGYDRKLILIEGRGMTLRHDNGQIDKLSNRFDMACFDGSWRTEATLHQGDILDFNVMTRQGVCRSDVHLFAENNRHPLPVKADCLLIFALQSELAINPAESDSIALAEGYLLAIRKPIAGSWAISGGACVCVQIEWD